MKTEPSTPADTRTMGIVHSALRRDLTRASDALRGPPVPGDAQRAAIAQHVQAMMDFLNAHHSGEDAWLWPTMRRLTPSVSELLDQMEDDHLAIVPHMENVTSAAAAYEKSAAGREALVSALSDLRASLDPHLRREEEDMMPIVATALTARQWDDWEQEYYLKSKSKSELGMEGHWLIDGADRRVYDNVVAKVNPVLRFVLLRYFGPKYRRACATRWGAGVVVGPKRD